MTTMKMTQSHRDLTDTGARDARMGTMTTQTMGRITRRMRRMRREVSSRASSHISLEPQCKFTFGAAPGKSYHSLFLYFTLLTTIYEVSMCDYATTRQRQKTSKWRRWMTRWSWWWWQWLKDDDEDGCNTVSGRWGQTYTGAQDMEMSQAPDN